jgi:hypothetical protein
VLDLRLDRDVIPLPQGRNKIDVITPAVQRFFAKVGRLTKLEELSLGHVNNPFSPKAEKLFAMDLTLEGGWLAELSGLKQLKHLRMYTDYWSSMDQDDVKFMDDNWPELERVSFHGFIGRLETHYHWRWLKERRPHIKLSSI